MNTQISLQLQIPQKTPFKNTEPDFSNFHKKRFLLQKNKPIKENKAEKKQINKP